MNNQQERILWEGFYNSEKCSGGVVARTGCTIRSSIVAFQVADPGFKSRPEHFFMYAAELAWRPSLNKRVTMRYDDSEQHSFSYSGNSVEGTHAFITPMRNLSGNILHPSDRP